jgi:DNA-binding transcriptional MerR regulator
MGIREMAIPKVPSDVLPLRLVSRATGLTPDVIRAWEKRYGVVAPQRGPRGARLYNAGDVTRLRLLGRVVATGRAIGDVAKLGDTELARLAAAEDTDGNGRPAPGDQAEALQRVFAALARFDATALDHLLSDAVIALGADAFCRRIARPLLEEVGRRWADGRASIADEHLLSASMRNLLAAIVRIRAAASGPVVLLATPTGERHEFGLLLAALMIADAGLMPCYLGTDLPAAEITTAARRAQAVVVGLGLVNGENHATALEEVRRVERRLPAETELWLGGAGAPVLARQLRKSRAIVLDDDRTVDRELERLRTSRRHGG